MERLSKSKSFVKLSGGFSELPSGAFTDIGDCVDRISPWFEHILRFWGPHRIIWGSDWPVCKVGADQHAIQRWIQICQQLLDKWGLADAEEDIFYNNAFTAYKLA
jgi:L-rhamnono-1,4-lactonase